MMRVISPTVRRTDLLSKLEGKSSLEANVDGFCRREPSADAHACGKPLRLVYHCLPATAGTCARAEKHLAGALGALRTPKDLAAGVTGPAMPWPDVDSNEFQSRGYAAQRKPRNV